MSGANLIRRRDLTLAPGDVVAIETEAGVRHVQVTHARAPYPDVVRAIRPSPAANAPADIARGETAFAAMAELAGAVARADADARLLGAAALPEFARAFPTFRLPIRSKRGEPIYWWTWDGDSLAIAPDGAATDLPLREVLTFDALRARLAALT